MCPDRWQRPIHGQLLLVSLQSISHFKSQLTIISASATTVVVTSGDVVHSSLTLGRVKERVDETQGRLALGLTVVIEDTNKSSNGRRRGRGSQSTDDTTVDVGLVLNTDEGDVGVATASRVEVSAVRAVEGVGKGGGVLLVVVRSIEVP